MLILPRFYWVSNMWWDLLLNVICLECLIPDMTLFDFGFGEEKMSHPAHIAEDDLVLYVCNSLTHARQKNESSTNQVTAFH